MKKIIALLLIISFNIYSYPIGFKATGLSTGYPSLIDFGFIKATQSGSTTTISSLGASLADSLAIGGAIDANAVIDVQSTTKASKVNPRMTTAQKLAIASPTAGMTVFDTTLNAPSYYDGTNWQNGLGTITVSTDPVAFTPTVANLGTISAGNTCNWWRESGDMLMRCYFVTGTTSGSGLASITIPNSLQIDSSKIPNNNTTSGSGYRVGWLTQNGSANRVYPAVVNVGTSTTLVYFADTISGSAALVPSLGSNLVSSAPSSVDIRIPILGWSSNNSTISASSINSDVANPSSTTTGSWSTNTTYTSKFGRLGANLQGGFHLALTGAPTSAALTVNLPSGNVIDTNRLPNGTGIETDLGQCVIVSAGTKYLGVLKYSSTTSVAVWAHGSTSAAVTQASPATFANGDSIDCVLASNFPIVGWSNVSQVVANLTNYSQVSGVTAPKLFSANITTTSGAVANNMGNIISSCTAANPTVCTLTGLTVAPNCGVGNKTAAAQNTLITAVSSSSITISTASASQSFDLNCMGY